MFMSLTAVGAGVAGSAAYLSPWIWRQKRMRAIGRELARRRVLSLTYDDGPSRDVTPKILDLLREHSAAATFFMLGRNAQHWPDIADRVQAEGHDIGCHSYEHVNAWKAAPWRAIADITAGYHKLSRWVAPDGMFRPPHGKVTLLTYLAIRRRGAPTWWWTIDSGDTWDAVPRPSDVADSLLRQGGGIVLMHDLDRSKERNDFVIETTALLLSTAKRESLKVLPLSQVCR